MSGGTEEDWRWVLANDGESWDDLHAALETFVDHVFGHAPGKEESGE